MVIRTMAKRPPALVRAQANYEAAKLEAGEHVQINVKLKTADDVKMIQRLRRRFPGESDPGIARTALRDLDKKGKGPK